MQAEYDYQLTLTSSLTDGNGNPLAPYSVSFNTGT